MPAISVIVPVYKVEKYIHRCIDSILAQTFTDFELILVDDGSPDSCGKICDEYAEKDSRIRVIHKPNGGVSSARNAGIDAARGEYLIFVDSDDKVEKHYIEFLYYSLTKSNSDLAISSYIRVQNDNYSCHILPSFQLELNELTDDQKILLYKLAKYYLIYGPYNKIYKTDIIRQNDLQFDETMSFGEDLFFVFSYLFNCKSISYINKPTYYYYSNSDSLLNKYREDRFENSLKINGIVKRFYEKFDCFIPEMQSEWAQRIFYDGYGCVSDIYSPKRNYRANYILERTKTIIGNPVFREALKSANTYGYPKKNIRLMKNGHAYLFFVIGIVKLQIKKVLHK